MTTCKKCGGELPAYIERVSFTNPETGALEYHPHAMGMWLANKAGHGDRVTEWTQSARGSKAGLVTGYGYTTDLKGYDGRAVYCSMDCAAEAQGLNMKPRRLGKDAAAGVLDGTTSRSGVSIAQAAGLDIFDGPRLAALRDRLKLTQAAFALALGYGGSEDSRKVIVSRMEAGQRAISLRAQVMAAMLEKSAEGKAQ